MGLFDRYRKWQEKRTTNKVMKIGSEIENLTNLQIDALKKRRIARRSGHPEEAMKWQKLSKEYQREIAKLQS